MKLKAVRDSILAADLVVEKKHLIEVASYNELFTQFSYIIDYDIDERLPFYNALKKAKFIHRTPWMGDLLPEPAAYDIIGDVTYHEDDSMVIYTGEYIRKLYPGFIIAMFGDIEEVVSYIQKYFGKH